MNSTQQAKNGFKTFLVTFMVSVLVFGAFYYLISDASTEDVSIETADSTVPTGLGKTRSVDKDSALPKVAGVTDVAGPQPVVEVEVEEVKDSPFADLAVDEVDVQGSAVLQAATTVTDTPQSTQTPVPETGDVSITFGIVSSLALFAFFAYLVFLNPRKYALAKFEQEISDNF